MSATDELRRMLDERGVEWTYSIGPFLQTNWEVGDVVWHAKELEHGFDVSTRYLTPEQAVEATLGATDAKPTQAESSGECHTVSMDCFGNPPFNQSGLNGNSTACGCSECGAPWSTCGLFRGNALRHNFKACPICGAKVVDE